MLRADREALLLPRFGFIVYGSGRSPENHAAAKTNATKMTTCCPVISNVGPSPEPMRTRLRLRRPFVKFDAAQFFFGFISVTVVSWLDNFESATVTSQRHRDYQLDAPSTRGIKPSGM